MPSGWFNGHARQALVGAISGVGFSEGSRKTKFMWSSRRLLPCVGRGISQTVGHFKLSPLKSTTTHKEWTTAATVITLHFAGDPPMAELWAFTDTDTEERLSPRTLGSIPVAGSLYSSTTGLHP